LIFLIRDNNKFPEYLPDISMIKPPGLLIMRNFENKMKLPDQMRVKLYKKLKEDLKIC